MAGDQHPVRMDPAIERWTRMHANMFRRFRMTPQAAKAGLVLGVAVPLALYAMAVNNDNKWDLRGKLRDEPLRNAPANATQPEESE